MRATRMGALAIALLAAPALAPATARAQTPLASRIAAAGNGVVRMSFAARPGVCGSGNVIGTSRGDGEWVPDCDHGLVRVALHVSDGRVTALRAHVNGQWLAARAGDHDLGLVPAREAAEALLGLAGAESPAGGHLVAGSDGVAAGAIGAAALADSAVVWPQLASLARSAAVGHRARDAAVFWLAERAGDRVDPRRGGSGSGGGRADDEAVRNAAIFALSQRPRGEAVPALMDVVRTSGDPAVRRRALFWLGQTRDPRAIDLFVRILKGR